MRLWEHHDRLMGTRASPEMGDAIQKAIPETHYEPDFPLGYSGSRATSGSTGRSPLCNDRHRWNRRPTRGRGGRPDLLIFCARVERAYDVGVAGIHRLFDRLDLITKAAVVVSVAGMEGALTSVVGGLVSCPVIGVPTSVGYGSGFNGLSALLSMLNSCATGVSVVNIDNGLSRRGRVSHPTGWPLDQPTRGQAMKIAYFDCIAGASGDMILGATCGCRIG